MQPAGRLKAFGGARASAPVRLLVELSGEHSTLPRAELLAVLRSFGEEPEIPPGRVASVETAVDPALLVSRLALSQAVHEEIVHGDFAEILDAARLLTPGDVPFSVRVKSYVTCDGKAAMEKQVGDRIRGRVDLVHPAVEYVVLVEAGGFHLTRRVGRTPTADFEKRRPSKRPFFHPTTLHPRYARALVNLSRCPPGGTLADPFCGTGGILLEALLCGFCPRGSDVSAEMVVGTTETLAAYRGQAEVSVGDVEGLRDWEDVGGIATDPPYGRAASTQRERLEPLYRRFFDAASVHARGGAAVAVILPSLELVDLGRETLRLEEAHTLRVHKSLDRHFCVFTSR